MKNEPIAMKNNNDDDTTQLIIVDVLYMDVIGIKSKQLNDTWRPSIR